MNVSSEDSSFWLPAEEIVSSIIMARFKLMIEYEGTRYSGWQIQKNARTVQGELSSAFSSVLNTTNFELYGAGRTDAGVHALQQVAHLEATTMLAPEILRRKVNDELPADINILEISKAAHQFHARHDAVARSYLYQISRRRTAFGKSLNQGMGLGRMWTPMVELLADRELATGEKTNWDLVPQFQVTLSRRQHVRANVGVRVPVNDFGARPMQVMFYLLWDWFDGGLLEGWK